MTTPSQPAGPDRGRSHPPADSGSDGPRSLIRSEEHLAVTTDQAESALVRLEKYTVTETKTITVEIEREHVRLITYAQDGDLVSTDDPPHELPDSSATPGAASEWLVLTEEQVVITKNRVAVERVRLQTSWITEQRQLTENVRAERIELSTDPHVVGAVTESEHQ